MAELGIPPLVLIVFLPFLTGLITGIAVGFVAASFPLVVPLIAARHGFGLSGLRLPGFFLRVHGHDALAGSPVLCGHHRLFFRPAC